jgi:hypothetical protein
MISLLDTLTGVGVIIGFGFDKSRSKKAASGTSYANARLQAKPRYVGYSFSAFIQNPST